jgi:predicted nucleic acid-binding protein
MPYPLAGCLAITARAADWWRARAVVARIAALSFSRAVLKFYEVTWGIARRAGELKNEWAKRGHTIALPDVTIAAVALDNGLIPVTDNRKHFPMPDLQLLPLPETGR